MPRIPNPRPTTLAVVALLVVALTTTTSGCSTSPLVVAPPPAPPPGVTSPGAFLTHLVIADEDTGAHVDRDEWGERWAHHQDGCSTRELALLTASVGARHGTGRTPVCPSDTTPCRTSPYDGTSTSTAGDLDIDHRVSVREAARSRVVGTGPDGHADLAAASVWSAADKHRFSDDIDNLTAVTSSVNRAMNDLDPGRWKPALESAWCDVATAYTSTKIRWALSVDHAEYNGLRQMLATCTAPTPTA